MGYKISIIKAKGQCSKKVQLSAEHSISGPGHRDSRAECQLGIFAGGFRKIKKNKPPKTKKRKKKQKSVYHKKQAASKVLHAFQSRAKLLPPQLVMASGSTWISIWSWDFVVGNATWKLGVALVISARHATSRNSLCNFPLAT